MTPEKFVLTAPAKKLSFYTKAFTSSEPWVTLQNAELTYGVGILYENGLLRYQGWQKSGVFNNVRSLLFFGLPPHGVVNARAYLILGNFDTVKAEAHWLMDNLPPFGVLDNPADGKSVSGKVDLSGWALDNKKVVKVEARIDESVTTALTYGTDRQDVCNVWIGYPSCNKVGFSGSIDVLLWIKIASICLKSLRRMTMVIPESLQIDF